MIGLKNANDGFKFIANKIFYVNFLVNTGNDGASGYFQLIFEQTGGTKLGRHFKGIIPIKMIISLLILLVSGNGDPIR